MADIEVKDLTLMTADITATDVIPIVDVSTGETLKTTTQTLLNSISSLAIKTGNGGDIGGYLMDGVDDYITVAAGNQANNIGLGDFSIEFFGKLKSESAYRMIYTRTAGSPSYKQITLWLRNDNKFDFITVVTDMTNHNNLVTTRTFTDDAIYHIVAVNSGVTSTIYINGVVEPSTYGRNTYDGSAIDLDSYVTHFGGGGYYHKDQMYLMRLYNKALSATEIASIYNNGRPDLYQMSILMQWGSNANIITTFVGTHLSAISPTGFTFTYTGGAGEENIFPFIRGGSYFYGLPNESYSMTFTITTTVGTLADATLKRINFGGIFATLVEGANTVSFSNINGTSVLFFAFISASNLTVEISDVVFTKHGCVAEYLPHNAGSLGWIESSGNQLSGATLGSPICLNKENRPSHYRDIRKAIAANTDTTLTGIVPKGYKIVSIRAKGSDSLADIKIGSASAGEQIVAATTTSSTTPKLLTLASTANDAYSESADVTLYARHDTSASGKTMDLIFHFEKVGN